MKSYVFGILIGLFTTGSLSAQEFKVSKNSGTIDIREVNNVTIEGSSGNEIIFSSQNNKRGSDERAVGIRAISSLGLEDNTGFGISVVDKGNVIEVRQLKKMDGPDIKILVPKNVKVAFYHTSPHGHAIEFKNFEGQVEVSTVHSGVVLSNATGPINIKTVHGDVDASFESSPKTPVSIESVHAHVDVALPIDTKASLKLSTHLGEILVDPAFKIDIEKTGDMVRYSDKVSGKINGGGVAIDLSSTHNNVYLRKK